MAENKKIPAEPNENLKREDCRMVVTENGPYLVSGGLPLAKEIIVLDDEDCLVEWGKGERYPDRATYSLCRCGQSSNKPFCDGSHVSAGFTDGDKTLGKSPRR